MTARKTPQHHCWGQVVCFSATARYCKECPEATSCAVEVRKRLAALQAKLDVTALAHPVQVFLDRKGVVRSDFKVELIGGRSLIGKHSAKFDVKSFSHLSKHAARLAESIQRAGIDVRSDAKHGANLFHTLKFRPAYMGAVQELLNGKTIYARDEFKQAIAGVADLKASSLRNTTSFVISALEALKVIHSLGDGTYALN